MKIKSTPLIITFTYLSFSAIWILASDLILISLVSDIQILSTIQTYKGLFFIALSSVIIYLLMSFGTNEKKKASLAFESLHSFTGILNLDGILTKANNTSLEFVGYDEKSVIGQPFWETPWWTHDPKMQDLLKEGIIKAAKGEFVRFEATHKGKKRELIYLDFSLKPIFNAKKVVIGIVPEGRDITSLRHKEIRYKALFQHAPDAITVMDGDQYIDCNSKATKLFDCPHEEMVKTKPYRLSPEIQPDGRNSKEKAQEKINYVINNKTSTIFEWKHMTAKGELFDAEISLSPIELGDKVLVQAFVRDVREAKKAKSDLKEAEEKRQEMQQQLNHSQKMDAIGTLAGGIAHDFNNILTGIFGHLKMASRNLDDSQKVQDRLTKIHEAADRAGQLVKQILTFSRKEENQKGPIDLNSLIHEAYDLLRASIPSSINLELSLKIKKATINGSATQIHQVIMNLVTNAYHAIGESTGKISIKLKEVNGRNHIEIKDDGIGISEDNIRKIFDPYFTTKGQGHGVGLGLSLVHGIITDHEGTITVASAPNVGSTFTIDLPPLENDQLENRSTSSTDIQGNGERILFVDDEDDIRNVLGDFLRDLGYIVDAFADPIKAFTSFMTNKNSYDLVLTDMTMPNMLGTELSAKILQIRPEIPIILCSGYSPLADRAAILNMGIKEFIEKPVDIEVLATQIKKTIS